MSLLDIPEECGIQNYTHLKRIMLNDDIGLTWSAVKLMALWDQSWFIITTSVLCFALFISVMFLNSLVLKHYIKKYKELIPLLYTSMSLCDIGNGISALLTGTILLMILCNYRSNQDTYPATSLMAKMTYIIFSLTSRVSIFFNTVLVAIRTIHVVFPTHVISRNRVMVVLVAGQVIWIFIAAFDVVGLQHILPYFDRTAVIVNETTRPVTKYTVLIDSMVVNPLTGFFVLYYIYDKMCNVLNFNVIAVYVLVKGIPFVLPSAMSIACMLIQTYFLIIRSRVGRHSAVSRRITVTVLYLTIIFVVCNIPDFVLNLVCLNVIAIPVKHLSAYMCVTFVSSVMLPFVNSLLNPLVLLMRGSSLKQSVMGYLCRSGSFRSSRSISNFGMEGISREPLKSRKEMSHVRRMIKREDTFDMTRMGEVARQQPP
ncbi:hypothetical protein ACHWQZ_G002269 [Mnemiopsis leidyi]